MNSHNKHAILGALGVGAIVLGSLAFALATGDGQQGDSTLRVFAGGLGVGLIITGIGVVISAAATYLRQGG